MKKKACVLISIVLLALLFVQPLRGRAEEYSAGVPTRVINVVYDDSGSMYRFKENGIETRVDTWCPAKYSMEVFASMLGEKDTMNVYYMHNYWFKSVADIPSRDKLKGPELVLKGSDNSAKNVRTIHDHTTTSSETPFLTVEKAYEDLLIANADEKWLVVLTDGGFQRVPGLENEEALDSSSPNCNAPEIRNAIDEYFKAKDPSVNVIFLGMGPSAREFRASDYPSRGVYSYQAEESKDILGQVTNICGQIFNQNMLNSVNVSSKSISLKVPMKEFIIFAQGNDVEITGVKRKSDGRVYTKGSIVTVKYSDCRDKDSKGNIHPNEPVKSLQGQIFTVKDDFDSGDYEFLVSGAETLEVYYKPNIDVVAYLTDANGRTLENLNDAEAGEYTITFGLVNASTREKVPVDKELLGDVEFSGVLRNNGNEYHCSDGDKIPLEEGTLEIDATANYLKYNYVRSHFASSGGVYKNKAITFEVEENPIYEVTHEGFVTDRKIKIHSKIEGKEFTREFWSRMDTPKVRLTGSTPNCELALSLLEKSEEPGVFYFSPVFPNGTPSEGYYKDVPFVLEYTQSFGSETWSGGTDGIINLKETRFLEREITFKESSMDYVVDKNGFVEKGKVKITAKLDGREFTSEQWEKMGVPNLTYLGTDGTATNIKIGELVKDDAIGVFYLEPYIDGETTIGVYGNLNYSLDYEDQQHFELWRGSMEKGVVRVTDGRPWWQQNWDKVKKIFIGFLILLLIWGYMPWVKHYLPRELVKQPMIKMTSKDLVVMPKSKAPRRGRVNKNIVPTVIIPYIAQRGTIKFVCGPNAGFPDLSVKGAKRRQMIVLNAKALAKKSITFDGNKIDFSEKDCRIDGNTTIVAIGNNKMVYTCYLDQEE